MQRMKASDFPQEVLNLFDGYVHGRISRREFIDDAGKFAVGGFTAAAMLEALRPNYAMAQQIARDDTRIKAEYVTFPSPAGSGTMKGYLARPANAAGKLPAVVVIHENRGLNPYIEDVARRLATDGFVAIAPDALTPLGGYPGNEEKAAQMFGQLDPAKRTEDLLAAYDYLASRPDTGKIGVVGFCFGGAMANLYATRFPDLGAAVPFYGGPPAADAVARIKAPLMIHYAGNDERINAGWPGYKTALEANNVRYEMFSYPNTQHGFHNDSTPRYDEAAARLAWSRTVAFLKKNLA